MKDIQAHICRSCGAALKLDQTRKVLTCPFCGVTYDYSYKWDKDSLVLARAYLMAHKYKEAKEAFEFLLTKDPNDPEVLRGLLLSTLGISNVRDLKNAGLHDLPEYEPVLDICIERAPKKNKELFNCIGRYLDLSSDKKTETKVLADLKKNDSTHIESEYDIRNKSRVGFFNEDLRDTLSWCYIKESGLTWQGKAMVIAGFVDLVFITAVIISIFDMPIENKIHGIGMIFAAVAIYSAMVFGIPIVINFIRGISVERYEYKELKSSILIEDTETIGKIKETEEKIKVLDEKRKTLMEKLCYEDQKIIER